MKLSYSKEVKFSLIKRKPILALESTIITHGLPEPQNLKLALELESIARELGVTPATIAIMNGVIKVGLERDEIKHLASLKTCYKFSSFDIPIALGLSLTGSTTVAGTSHIAHKAGIKVFSTGGIGGVHKEESSRMDISHDLKSLSFTPIVLVSSGAKCILDLESTVEQLETLGIPHLGWKTKELPAFYYNKSGIPLPYQADNINQITSVARNLESSALLVANPIPKEAELSKEWIEELIKEAHEKAKEEKILGKALTPYLLSYLWKKSEGRTLETNCALIRSNVKLGSQICRDLHSSS